jgi:hypothetical protein
LRHHLKIAEIFSIARGWRRKRWKPDGMNLRFHGGGNRHLGALNSK